MLLEAKPYVEMKIKELKERVEKLETKPKLVIIRVGNDKASEKYVNNKIKRCEEVGIESQIIHLREDISQDHVAFEIQKLNNNQKTSTTTSNYNQVSTKSMPSDKFVK